MNKNEKEIVQNLREKTEHIEAPDSLHPENIEKMLETKAKKRKITPLRIGAAVAACIVLAAGVAVYQDQQKVNTLDSATAEVKLSDSKVVETADEYEDIYAYLDEYMQEMEQYKNEQKSSTGEEFLMEDSVAQSAADSGASTMSAGMERAEMDMEAGDYSETNIRQEGVDEGDVVKTDGTYLYVLKDNSNQISIVDTRENTMKEIQTIEAEDVDSISEFYLNEDKHLLIAVCRRYSDGDGLIMEDRYWGGSSSESTVAVTYNIADPAKPEEVGRVTQSGSYETSRLADGYLYLFSDYYINMTGIQRSQPETFIPLVNDSALTSKNIYLPSVSRANMYQVITAIDLSSPGETADSKALLCDGGQLYVSNENIYFYSTIWDYPSGNKTTIQRIGYKNGKLEAGAQGKIKGYINDSFSIDEYDSYLRVVATENDTNSVYVLNQDLEITGEIKNLAKDERIYSARLMGKIGYFVTFRETDPLFSVDLSDPKNPEIIGSLKIPGFSDYLHPYGKDKLLGIGMDVDEETLSSDGVKLTMFDISDPTDVKEEATYVLENVYYTDVSYDYKAALVNADKNMIGFAGSSEGGQTYFLFEYDEKNGFISNMAEEINGSGISSTRGVYIGEVLYVVQGNIIESYSLKDFAKIDDIIL